MLTYLFPLINHTSHRWWCKPCCLLTISFNYENLMIVFCWLCFVMHYAFLYENVSVSHVFVTLMPLTFMSVKWVLQSCLLSYWSDTQNGLYEYSSTLNVNITCVRSLTDASMILWSDFSYQLAHVCSAHVMIIPLLIC